MNENYDEKTTDRDGTTYYTLHGKLHRLDGPAAECTDGWRGWYQHGKRHRVDGPAIEWSDGSKEWWVNGRHYKTQRGWKRAVAGFQEATK